MPCKMCYNNLDLNDSRHCESAPNGSFSISLVLLLGLCLKLLSAESLTTLSLTVLYRNSAGFVYLRFENVAAAINAQHGMHLRWFAGRSISAIYMVCALLPLLNV